MHRWLLVLLSSCQPLYTMMSHLLSHLLAPALLMLAAACCGDCSGPARRRRLGRPPGRVLLPWLRGLEGAARCSGSLNSLIVSRGWTRQPACCKFQGFWGQLPRRLALECLTSAPLAVPVRQLHVQAGVQRRGLSLARGRSPAETTCPDRSSGWFPRAPTPRCQGGHVR